MDEFIATVEPQVLKLDNLDIVVLLTNIQFVHIYENKDGSDDFMPFDALKQSFYKALQRFPVFAGYIKEPKHGNFEVIVDRNDLNMPDYYEATSDIHYSELKAANFCWDKWPKEIEMTPLVKVDATGNIKNVNVCVVRLRANSGLFVSLSIAHGLVDGVGFYEFAELWAKICKEMRNGGTDFAQLHKPLVFDRSILKSKMPETRRLLDCNTRLLYTQPSIISKFFAWLSCSTRLLIASNTRKLVSCEAHMFHISRETLDRIHGSMKQYIPDGARISDNDLISSLLSMTFAQSERREAAAGDKGYQLGSLAGKILNPLKRLLPLQKEKDFLIGIACDSRSRLGIGNNNYTGNSTITPFLKFLPADLTVPITPESLTATAMHVRKMVNMIDAGYAASLLDTMDEYPTFYTNLFTVPMSYSFLGQTNHTRLNMYTPDFGDGSNQWCSFIPGLKHNLAMIQPCPPGVDGVNIFIEAEERIMKNMLSNEYWTAIAEFLF